MRGATFRATSGDARRTCVCWLVCRAGVARRGTREGLIPSMPRRPGVTLLTRLSSRLDFCDSVGVCGVWAGNVVQQPGRTV